jgi:integrase
LRANALPQYPNTARRGLISLVQLTLLTAARRNELAKAARSERVADDRLVIPPARYKTEMHLVIPLSSQARDLLAKFPKIGKNWIFSCDGKRPLGGFSKPKRDFDKAVLKILCKDDPEASMERWTLHDLRRTARTLMSRAKVPQDIAERCIGHVQGDMVETYDLYEFFDEKRDAFEALAQLVMRIVDPADTIIPMKSPVVD